MTAFIATLAPACAVISTDSLARYADGRICLVDKLRVLSASRAVLAGAGSLGAIIEWGIRLQVLHGGSDIQNIIDVAPAGLADLWREIPGAHGEGLRMVHVGWADGGPVGAAHEFPDFQAQHFAVGRGHCMQPEVDPIAPGYEVIEARWESAAAGVEVDTFHLAVLRNQRWAVDQGRAVGLHAGTVIGGPILTARIDAHGISVRQIGDLGPPRHA